MRTLVWGFGNYYNKKEKSILKDSIIAFVSSKEIGRFDGIEIIKPRDISRFKYDYLYIMVDVKIVFEIIDELRQLKYRDWNKIVFGWNVKPYTSEEKLLFEDGKVKCNMEGICIYDSPDFMAKIENEKDWNRLRQKKLRCKKKFETKR